MSFLRSVYRNSKSGNPNKKTNTSTIDTGSNNVGWFSEEDIARGISAIVDELQIRLPHTQVLLLGILVRSNSDTVAIIERTNTIISAREYPNRIRYLNMNNAFFVNGQFLTQYFSSLTELVHLNAAGFLRWDETMHPLFTEMWNAP